MADREQEVFTVDEQSAGMRLDAFCARACQGRYSRTKLKQAIEKGTVRVNGQLVSPHTLVALHDVVHLGAIPEQPLAVAAEHIPLDIVYEDDDIIVVNKAPGMVVHPGAGNREHTLVNALRFHTRGALATAGGEERAGIVHRLDKDTSGIMVIAKNDQVHRALADQFKDRTTSKEYAVIVKGVVQHDEGTCTVAIGRGRVFRKRMVARDGDGKEAISVYHVRERFPQATYLAVTIMTGRTHQIRVHMAHMGHPVLGDTLYGVVTPLIHRQCIHARKLSLTHPRSGKRMTFEAPLPDDMCTVLTSLRTAGAR